MNAAQACYGSFREFSWAGPNAALAGNLSGFLPEDRFDRQPLWTADRAHCMVADVRLDNREDLARELGLSAPELLADSAILLVAWQCWDEACLARLLGSFAFAVWTPHLHRLFAARDHTGDRPLCYVSTPDLFAVASMPKALLTLPGVERTLDEERMLSALILSVSEPGQSFYRDVHKVPQAHFVRSLAGQVVCEPYWNPFDAPPVRFKRDEEYPEAMRDLLDRAVAARLRSSSGIASHLSAGLDSSSVLTSAALQLAGQGQQIIAFTAVPRPGFLGRGLHGRLPDEGPAAAEVARLYANVVHVRVDSAGIDLLPLLHSLTRVLDEPVQNGINALWLDAVERASAERSCKVLLQGARGNATISFNGFEGLAEMFRQGRWIKLARTVRKMRANGMISYRQGVQRSLWGLLPQPVNLWLQRAGTFELNYSAGNPALLLGRKLRERMLEEFFDNSGDLRAEQTMFFERFDYGAHNAQTQAQSNIDPRDPTCDKRLFEFCYNIPFEQYLVGGVHRSMARRALRDRLPAATLARSVRGQQGADWYLSMQDALPSFRLAALQVERSPSARRILDLPRMRTLLDTFPATGLEQLDTSQSWGDALCRFMSFGYFLERFD